jgi:hypothetical protein
MDGFALLPSPAPIKSASGHPLPQAGEGKNVRAGTEIAPTLPQNHAVNHVLHQFWRSRVECCFSGLVLSLFGFLIFLF